MPCQPVGSPFIGGLLNMIMVLPKILKFYLLLLGFAVLLGSGFWGLVQLTGKKPIYIAVAVPTITDPENTLTQNGTEMLQGIQLYLDQINQQGGVAGRKIYVKVFHDQSDPEQARLVAQQITNQKNIPLVLGHFNNVTTLAATPIYAEANLPALSASSTKQPIVSHDSANTDTTNNPWYYYLVPDNETQIQFVTKYVKSILKKPSIAIIYDQEEYDTAFETSFKKEANALSLGIQDIWAINPSESKEVLEDKLNKIADQINSKTEDSLLYLSLRTEQAIQLLVMLQKRRNLTIVCSSSCATRDFIHQLKIYPKEHVKPGYYSDGLYVTTPFITDIAGEEGQKFHQDFEKKYHQTPSWVAALYYDAAQLAISALEYAYQQKDKQIQTIREQIQQYFNQHYDQQHSIPGISGDIYFNLQKQAKLPVSIGSYQQQQLISTTTQFRPALYKQPVDITLNKLLTGEAFFIDGSVLDKVNVVYTGMNINSITNLNLSAGTYTLDAYLWFRFHGDFDEQNIEFLNAAEPISLIPVLKETDQDYYIRTYRLKGKFSNNFTFHDYPFDKQNIVLKFRHNKLKRNELIYIPDLLGMHQNKINPYTTSSGNINPLNELNGWFSTGYWYYQDVMRSNSTLGIPRYFDQRNGLDYSRFNMVLQLKRNTRAFMVKNLLPIFLLLIIAYIAYFMPVQKVEMRIGLGSNCLLASAFFHLQLSAGLGVSYLVAIEYFFYAIYILSGAIILIAIIAFYLDKTITDEEAQNKTNETEDEKIKSQARKQKLTNYLKLMTILGRTLHPGLVLLVILWMIYRYN